MEPGVKFYDLQPVATISGAITATNAGTTPEGMAMALAYEHALGQYNTKAASVVGTSQEGEALVLCVRQLAPHEGVYWVVPDSESAVGALRTYQDGGHCADKIHHLYA